MTDTLNEILVSDNCESDIVHPLLVYPSEQCINCVDDRLCMYCAFKGKQGQENLNLRAISACEKDDVETLQQILKEVKDLSEHIDETGRTLVCIAASNASYECFKEMVSRKSDLNWKSDKGYTPLHEVCDVDETENSKNIFKLLLKNKKVDLNAKTIEGKTAVMIAYEAGNKEIWQTLAKWKTVDLSIKDSKEQTLKDKIAKDLENQNGFSKTKENQLKFVNDEEKERRHYGFKSSLYNQDQYETFLKDVEIGDLIEFDRGMGYQHWAVWVGPENKFAAINRSVIITNPVDDLICHRGVENNYNVSNLVSQSDILAKEERGIGDIYFDSFKSVAKNSSYRINNIEDLDSEKVFTGKDILERLSDVALKSKYNMGEYHFLKNNCEHFVKWARNDKKRSLQSLFAAYKVSFVILAFLICGIIGGAYYVWKDVSSEERSDTKFCGCRTVLDEKDFENVQYSYGEMFISKKVDRKDEIINVVIEMLEMQNLSSIFHSKEILIASAANMTKTRSGHALDDALDVDFCASIQVNSSIAEMISLNYTSCNTCHGSRDRLFKEEEIYFWVLSAIIVVLIPWLFFGILAGSHKTGLQIRKVCNIFEFNVMSLILWINMAFMVQIFITRRCCKYTILPVYQAQIIAWLYISIILIFFELPSIYNLGWKTLSRMTLFAAAFLAGSCIGIYILMLLIIGFPTRDDQCDFTYWWFSFVMGVIFAVVVAIRLFKMVKKYLYFIYKAFKNNIDIDIDIIVKP